MSTTWKRTKQHPPVGSKVCYLYRMRGENGGAFLVPFDGTVRSHNADGTATVEWDGYNSSTNVPRAASRRHPVFMCEGSYVEGQDHNFKPCLHDGEQVYGYAWAWRDTPPVGHAIEAVAEIVGAPVFHPVADAAAAEKVAASADAHIANPTKVKGHSASHLYRHDGPIDRVLAAIAYGTPPPYAAVKEIHESANPTALWVLTVTPDAAHTLLDSPAYKNSGVVAKAKEDAERRKGTKKRKAPATKEAPNKKPCTRTPVLFQLCHIENGVMKAQHSCRAYDTTSLVRVCNVIEKVRGPGPYEFHLPSHEGTRLAFRPNYSKRPTVKTLFPLATNYELAVTAATAAHQAVIHKVQTSIYTPRIFFKKYKK